MTVNEDGTPQQEQPVVIPVPNADDPATDNHNTLMKLLTHIPNKSLSDIVQGLKVIVGLGAMEHGSSETLVDVNLPDGYSLHVMITRE